MNPITLSRDCARDEMLRDNASAYCRCCKSQPATMGTPYCGPCVLYAHGPSERATCESVARRILIDPTEEKVRVFVDALMESPYDPLPVHLTAEPVEAIGL